MKHLFTLLALFLLGATHLAAGNPERSGQAGATQLLINPWARSSSWNGIDLGGVYGIEALATNPAGLAKVRRTELDFTHTQWLSGSDIRINTFGFGQKLGTANFVGIQVMAFDLGDFTRTTIDQPDGTLGTFSPTFLNITLGFAHAFLDGRINVGGAVKLVHESIPDASANGVAFDAGVQYTNESRQFRLGVSLRNIGPEMRYTGDGLATRTQLGNTTSPFDNAVSVVAAPFQLPSVLMLGLSYEFRFGGSDDAADFFLTPAASFFSNTFSQDQVGVGVEFSFRRWISIRGAQLFERDGFDSENTRNAFTGLAGGLTVELPLGKNTDTTFGVDYSYRHTYFFNGTHAFGFRINL